MHRPRTSAAHSWWMLPLRPWAPGLELDDEDDDCRYDDESVDGRGQPLLAKRVEHGELPLGGRAIPCPRPGTTHPCAWAAPSARVHDTAEIRSVAGSTRIFGPSRSSAREDSVGAPAFMTRVSRLGSSLWPCPSVGASSGGFDGSRARTCRSRVTETDSSIASSRATPFSKATSYQVSSVRDASPGSFMGWSALNPPRTPDPPRVRPARAPNRRAPRARRREVAALRADHEPNRDADLRRSHRNPRVHDQIIAHAIGELNLRHRAFDRARSPRLPSAFLISQGYGAWAASFRVRG